MELLPKDYRDFQTADYWESFFKKRGDDAFEWYVEYGDISGILGKYLKPADTILVVGCGNSKLSADIYDAGYQKQQNIDISETVIEQMREVNRFRADMDFHQMDVMKMTYEDDHFSVVIDKGTLDALMVDESDAVQERVRTMFREVGRVLRVGGRYIIISMLQERVLKAILSYYTEQCWCIRVHPINRETECGLPIFAVVLTKFKKMPGMKSIVEVANYKDEKRRLGDPEALFPIVKEMQYYGMVQQTVSKGKCSDETPAVCLYEHAADEHPRYTLHIIDTPLKTRNKKFAIFLVPQGGEMEWLFCTPEGRREVARQAGYERLVIVLLNRHHHYTNKETMESYLDGKVMQLAPPSYKPGMPVPYLTRGDHLGNRVEIDRDHSQMSGDYVVEDVDLDGKTYRRLVFLSAPNLVQSEARLKHYFPPQPKGATKTDKMVHLEDNPVDKSYLASQFHVAMSAGLVLASPKPPQQQGGMPELKLLLVGLGGGCLPVFLQDNFPNLTQEVVDIDEAMVKVAKEYFAFKPGPKLQVHIEDGLKYVEEKQEEGARYSAVMFDVDSRDLSTGMSCPPAAFLEPEFLDTTSRLLDEEGVFILNLVCRDETLKRKMVERLESKFGTVIRLKIENDVNEVCFACPKKRKKPALLNAVKKAMAKINMKIEGKSSRDLKNLPRTFVQMKWQETDLDLV